MKARDVYETYDTRTDTVIRINSLVKEALDKYRKRIKRNQWCYVSYSKAIADLLERVTDIEI